MGLARQAKGTDAEEALLITAELQEAAVVHSHLLLHQLHRCLHFSHLVGLHIPIAICPLLS